jgi:hypothetical protein
MTRVPIIGILALRFPPSTVTGYRVDSFTLSLWGTGVCYRPSCRLLVYLAEEENKGGDNKEDPRHSIAWGRVILVDFGLVWCGVVVVLRLARPEA